MTIPRIVVAPGTTNLVTNPSFETNTSGWQADRVTITRDTTSFTHGVASLRVSRTADTATNVSTYATVTGLSPSTWYSLSIDLIGEEDGHTTRIFILQRNSANTMLSLTESPDLALTTEWQRYSLSLLGHASLDRALVGVQGVRNDTVEGTALWVDAVQFEQRQTPTPFTTGTRPDKRLPGYMDLGSTHIGPMRVGRR